MSMNKLKISASPRRYWHDYENVLLLMYGSSKLSNGRCTLAARHMATNITSRQGDLQTEYNYFRDHTIIPFSQRMETIIALKLKQQIIHKGYIHIAVNVSGRIPILLHALNIQVI